MARNEDRSESPARSDRRQAFRDAAAIVAGGVAVTVLGNIDDAAARENRDGDLCLTVMFPNGEAAEFDVDYYVEHHIPLIFELYGDSIRRYEVFQPEPGEDGEEPQYLAITHIWIADADAFAKASAEHRDEFAPDVPNFTNVTPVAQMQRLHSVLKP